MMRKVIAVTLLDLRRLSFGLVSLGLVAGLAPSLASGIGETISPGTLLALNLVIAGLVAGACLGNDFSEGRSSFFFARPLSVPSFLLGRVAATIGLAGLGSAALLATYWLSSPEPTLPRLSPRNAARAVEFTINGWAVALYFSLAVACRDRGHDARKGPRAVLTSMLRILGVLAAFVFVFGLFADLVVRAYLVSEGLVTSFLESWLITALAASCLAIAAGRTEGMRIARTQNLVMFSGLILAGVSVGAAWQYTLHPGPEAIRSVWYSAPSPDGRLAYVRARVDRGDGETFLPVFVVDPAARAARLLTADPGQGPWFSGDGRTMAWVEATPFFFRPLFWMAGGTVGFKVRGDSQAIEDIPMPTKLQARFKTADRFARLGWFGGILPSDGGEVFAVRWDHNLTFVSRSGVQLSELRLGGAGREVVAASFVPSGQLRVALAGSRTSAAGVEFADLDPATGALTHLASAGPARVRFDRGASHALLLSHLEDGRGSVALVDLSKNEAAASPVVLVSDGARPLAVFLADGRVAVSAGGADGGLTVFSDSGKRLLAVPAEKGTVLAVRGEMFPGILAVQSFHEFGAVDLALIDGASGRTLRRIPNSFALSVAPGPPPPPGSPAARLIQTEGRLYELPSVTAEPRLLLPLPVR